MMRWFLVTIVFSLAFTAIPVGGKAGATDPVAFLSTIDDLPLMPGLRETPGEGMVFDSPAGRIVEAFATGIVAPSRILDFYTRTLPQLGWRHLAAGKFQRDDEILEVTFPGHAARSDRAGADRAGADRAGADRAGADRAGADRAGTDHADADHAGADRTRPGLIVRFALSPAKTSVKTQ